MSDRVSPQIVHIPWRRLPKRYDNAGTAAGTTKAIGISAPLSTQGLEIAMGIAGDDNIVSLVVDVAATITAYGWCSVDGLLDRWVLMGANSTQSQKAFDALAVDGFNMPKGCPFLLVASTPVTNCYLDAPAHASQPD